jgi:hypothetical protein
MIMNTADREAVLDRVVGVEGTVSVLLLTLTPVGLLLPGTCSAQMCRPTTAAITNGSR